MRGLAPKHRQKSRDQGKLRGRRKRTRFEEASPQIYDVCESFAFVTAFLLSTALFLNLVLQFPSLAVDFLRSTPLLASKSKNQGFTSSLFRPLVPFQRDTGAFWGSHPLRIANILQIDGVRGV